jgi:hypothetical protein
MWGPSVSGRKGEGEGARADWAGALLGCAKGRKRGEGRRPRAGLQGGKGEKEKGEGDGQVGWAQSRKEEKFKYI